MSAEADLFMKRGASISRCGTLRWTLERAWAEGPAVCYIGHNPSTATATYDDPTVQAWTALARANGFGRFVAVNLYPFRAADVRECRRWADYEQNGPDWAARNALMHNETVVVEVAKKADIVVACWGALAADSMWVDHIVEAIHTGEEPWPDLYCLGTTLAGDPKHPMARGKHRIARDQRFTMWRAAR